MSEIFFEVGNLMSCLIGCLSRNTSFQTVCILEFPFMWASFLPSLTVKQLSGQRLSACTFDTARSFHCWMHWFLSGHHGHCSLRRRRSVRYERPSTSKSDRVPQNADACGGLKQYNVPRGRCEQTFDTVTCVTILWLLQV